LQHGKAYLSSALYYKDDATEMDNIYLSRVKTESNTQVAQTVNEGFLKRRDALVKGKGVVEMFGPLHIDLIQIN
jgi:hypothetical protein